MFLVKPPFFVPFIFHRIVWNLPSKEKIIYLTFDDGPIPQTTTWILETLEKYNAKATFFCVGDNVQKYPELFEEIKLKGHSVGNHTYHHINGWKCTTSKYLSEVVRANKLIQSNLFRPPYGKISLVTKQVLLKKYHIIMWDVLSRDFSQSITEFQCLENVLLNAQKGSVVVFHDSVKAFRNLEYTLPKVLEYYNERGYCFSKIEADEIKLKQAKIDALIKMKPVKTIYKRVYKKISEYLI